MSADAQRQQENVRSSTFSNRLDFAMKVRGESPLSLSTKLGLSHTTVGRWLRGAKPGSEQIERISNSLSVNAHWLLTGEGEGPSESAGRVKDESPGYRATDAYVLEVIRGGPALAAKSMDRDELVEKINEHALQLKNCPKYQWGPQAEIISAFALELYRKTKPKEES